MENDCIEKVRIARHEWRAAAEEYFRVRMEYERAPDGIDGSYVVPQAATKERIALEKYQRAVKAFVDVFEYLPSPTDD